jgi:hypothetical protein
MKRNYTPEQAFAERCCEDDLVDLMTAMLAGNKQAELDAKASLRGSLGLLIHAAKEKSDEQNTLSIK